MYIANWPNYQEAANTESEFLETMKKVNELIFAVAGAVDCSVVRMSAL